jgi:hypothetical protein
MCSMNLVVQGREIFPTAADRVGIYRQFVSFMKHYFHDDALGRKRAFYFLPWHLEFLCRYRPYPAAVYESSQCEDSPLMSIREGIVNTHVRTFFGFLGATSRQLLYVDKFPNIRVFVGRAVNLPCICRSERRWMTLVCWRDCCVARPLMHMRKLLASCGMRPQTLLQSSSSLSLLTRSFCTGNKL